MSLSLSIESATAFGSLNAYWGQWGGHRLREVCDSGVQYASVSFVTKSPEHGNGYPATNFGGNCAADVYSKDGKKTELLSNCYRIKEDIPYCQNKGVKVLLSIGGESSTSTNYNLYDTTEGVEFAEFLYNAFGPYQSSWDGPRPFDTNTSEHVAVDGFDLDLEDSSVAMEPYVAMVNHWRQQSNDLYIAAAPQCVTKSNHLDLLINEVKLDALFVQFYNNPVCDAILGNEPNDSFSYDNWVSKISEGKSKNAKIFIGLPAAPAAASTGYITPAQLKDLVCENKGKPNFGGISLWDATFGLNNKDLENKSYLQVAIDALNHGCDAVPTTTSTAVPTTSTTSDETSLAATTNQQSTINAASEKPTTTAHWSNSTKHYSLTTSTVFTTKTYTVTSCASAETKCSKGRVTTETVPLYTTVCPVTETAQFPKPTTTEAPSLTISTAYTTRIQTITSCPPSVLECPKGQITTEVIALYTALLTKVQHSSSLKTSVRSTVTVPLPSSEACSGAVCAGATSTADFGCTGSECTADSGCTGPECTADSGCTGPECPGAVILNENGTNYPVGTPVTPSIPLKASASVLALSLTGLVAMVVAQVLVM